VTRSAFALLAALAGCSCTLEMHVGDRADAAAGIDAVALDRAPLVDASPSPPDGYCWEADGFQPVVFCEVAACFTCEAFVGEAPCFIVNLPDGGTTGARCVSDCAECNQ